MGKKKAQENSAPSPFPSPSQPKEGHNLLGLPKFKKLENGRFKCVQTGHELPENAKEAYAQSKHCRLGLIDSALARNKPPLNMFTQDPASRSKLICKLTGDTINKSEEHIWKHMTGKRFLNMLEKEEAAKEEAQEAMDGTAEKPEEKMEEDKKKKKKKKKKKTKEIKEVEKTADEIINEVRDPAGKSSDSETELDFWMPPDGERWDHDDGGERWGSDSELEQEGDEVGEEEAGVEEAKLEAGVEEAKLEAGKLSKQTKRMSLEIGPSSFASKKKKKKTSVA